MLELEREGAPVVESRGSMRVGSSRISWHTAQSDPSDWIAVGSETGAGTVMHVPGSPLVGVGQSEAEATRDLLRQAEGALDAHAWPAHEWVTEWSL